MSIWDTWAADPRYQQLLSNPSFLQATPQFKQGIHDLLFNYGIQPTAQQQTDYGVGPIENNPYSVVNMLQKGHTQADHSSMNQANAAGLEESGAAAGALNANNEAYKAKYAGALAQATGGIGQLLTGYTNQVGNIFDTLEQNPVVPAAQYPGNVGPAAGAPTGVGTSYPTPQTPYTRTGSEAGGLAAKLIKPKKPGIGGMGHIT